MFLCLYILLPACKHTATSITQHDTFNEIFVAQSEITRKKKVDNGIECHDIPSQSSSCFSSYQVGAISKCQLLTEVFHVQMRSATAAGLEHCNNKRLFGGAVHSLQEFCALVAIQHSKSGTDGETRLFPSTINHQPGTAMC